MTRKHELDQPLEEWDPEFEAVRRASNSHIVIEEDETHRKLIVFLLPGMREPLHYHPWPSKFILFRSTPLRYYHHDGSYFDIPQRDASNKNPYIEEMEPEGLHAVENLSSADPYIALRIEYKTGVK